MQDRLRGGLYGLLIGDALGVPYEFHKPEAVPPLDRIEMTPPTGFRRAHNGVPPGTWSDDGAQALLLLEALLRNASLNLDEFGRGLLAWWRHGRMTPDGVVFDIGIQTSQGLLRIERGVPAQSSGSSDEHANGNGSLMRALPCALVPYADRAQLIDRARRQGLPTHGHVRTQMACTFSALIGAELLRGLKFAEALDAAQDFMESNVTAAESAELKVLLDGRLDAPRGSGYVVDSFWSAVASVLRTDSYEDCVKQAIALGHDTDTTACIAGGWAGLLYGEGAIPARWREALQGRAKVEELWRQLARAHDLG